MKMFFRGAGATYLVSDPPPASVPTEKTALDEHIVFFIWTSMSEDVKYLVEGKESGLEAWKAVLGHFEKSNVGRRLQARQDLYHIIHDPSKPISAYIHSVEQASQVLKDLKAPVGETELGDILLMNLHESYSTVRTTILTSKDEPDFKTIKSVLAGSSISTISSISIKQEPDIFPAANAVRTGRRSNFLSTSPPSSVDAKGFRWCNPDNEGHCHRCGRPNHVARLCIFDMPQHIKDWVMQGPPRGNSSTPAPTHEDSNFTYEEVAGYVDASNILGPLHI